MRWGLYQEDNLDTVEVLELHGYLCLCGDKATQVHCKTIGSVKNFGISNLSALCQHCYDYYNKKRPDIKAWKDPYPKQRIWVIYTEYIESGKWQDKRSEVLARDNNRCVCGNPATDVHHKTYTNFGDEPISDLIALCRDCHTAITKEITMYNFDDLDANLRNQLDTNQYNLATTRTQTGYRRVKGSAGSGKSLALAGRAAKLISEEKRILVCNFNIALINYLEELVGQFIDPLGPQITFIHFHDWCKFVCQETNHMKTYLEERASYSRQYKMNEWFDFRMAELVSEIYESSNTLNLPKYDAILVDEGHDFHVNWWTLLRKALVPEGEALFVCDKTQDLYRTAKNWTEESMLGLGCGFTGPWMELHYNYRLPTGFIPILEDFVEEYLEHYNIDANVSFLQQSPSLGESLDTYRWVQVEQGTSVEDVCIREIEFLDNDPDISTVCFLSGKAIGERVVQGCKRKGMKIFHTHHKDRSMSRESKLNLRPGCDDIVATTVHSFKGWEASHLVVHIDKIDSLWDCNVFYTALSRLKRNDNGVALTVVSSCRDLEAFGRRNFPDFILYDSNIMEDEYEDDIPF